MPKEELNMIIEKVFSVVTTTETLEHEYSKNRITTNHKIF